MILHFLIYSNGTESQFAQYVIDQFASPDLCSEFVIVTSMDVNRDLFVSDKVKVVNSYNKKAMVNLIDSLHNYSAIVLHGLFEPWCEIVLRKVPKDVKVAWVFWGGEIYGRKDLKETFLTKRSKRLLWLRNIKKELEKKNNRSKAFYELPKELFHRIDYCLTDIHEDFEFVKAYCGFDAKELWYNYYSIDETLGELRNQSVDGNNILIGNSCTLECNHLDGFYAIKGKVDKNSEVIVPLSYGEPWLRRCVVKMGELLFGNQFHPLVDFMPRDDYNNVIKSCSVAIMPHYRPQAFGNILTALWLGTRVYMSEKSVLYKFFKRIGAVVFSIEKDLDSLSAMTISPLTEEERNMNRALIAQLYNKDVMNVKIRELVCVLNEKNT